MTGKEQMKEALRVILKESNHNLKDVPEDASLEGLFDIAFTGNTLCFDNLCNMLYAYSEGAYED